MNYQQRLQARRRDIAQSFSADIVEAFNRALETGALVRLNRPAAVRQTKRDLQPTP